MSYFAFIGLIPLLTTSFLFPYLQVIHFIVNFIVHSVKHLKMFWSIKNTRSDYIQMVFYSLLICPSRVSLWFPWIAKFHGPMSSLFLLPALLAWLPLPRLFEPNQNVTKRRWGWQCLGSTDVDVLLPVAGLELPYPAGLSFPWPSSIASTLKREKEMRVRTTYAVLNKTSQCAFVSERLSISKGEKVY